MAKLADTPENRTMLAFFGLDYDALDGELPKWAADALSLATTSGRSRTGSAAVKLKPTAEQRAKLDAQPCTKPWQPSGKASPTSFQAALNASLTGVLDWREAVGCRKMECICGATFYDPNPAKVAYRREILCPVCGKSIFAEGEPSERG